MLSNLDESTEDREIHQFMEGFEVEQVMFIPDLENPTKKKAIIKLRSPVDDSCCETLMQKPLKG